MTEEIFWGTKAREFGVSIFNMFVSNKTKVSHRKYR